MTDVAAILAEHRAVMDGVAPLAPQLDALAARLVDLVRAGGALLWIGNGGSAAEAQHFAGDLVNRFERDRGAIRSLALTADSAVITAAANDVGYDTVFARQIEAICRPGDAVIALSTSGRSVNVLRGVEAARVLGARTVALTGGDGGELAALVDDCVCVPATSTARIQEAHMVIGHALCARIEAAVAAEGRP